MVKWLFIFRSELSFWDKQKMKDGLSFWDGGSINKLILSRTWKTHVTLYAHVRAMYIVSVNSRFAF